MQTIDTTAREAMDTLVALAAHVPPDVPLGRPLVALGSPDGPPDLLTTEGEQPALWSLEQDQAARYMELDGGWREVTRWRQGVEVSRALGRAG